MHRQKLQARLGNRAKAMPQVQFRLAATLAMHSPATTPASNRVCRLWRRWRPRCRWAAIQRNVAIASPNCLYGLRLAAPSSHRNMSAEELAPALLSQRSQRAAGRLGLCRAVEQRLAQFLHRRWERGRSPSVLAASYGTIFSSRSVELFHEARHVRITHGGTLHLARPIRDVGFAGRHESVAGAGVRCRWGRAIGLGRDSNVAGYGLSNLPRRWVHSVLRLTNFIDGRSFKVDLLQIRAEREALPHEAPETAASLRSTRVPVESGDRASGVSAKVKPLRLIQPCSR